MQKYEGGKDRCSAYKLKQIATVLDVSVDVLYEDVTLPSGQAKDVREAMRIVEAIQRITNPAVRHRLLVFVEALGGPADRA